MINNIIMSVLVLLSFVVACRMCPVIVRIIALVLIVLITVLFLIFGKEEKEINTDYSTRKTTHDYTSKRY